jgi:hypothetical protein
MEKGKAKPSKRGRNIITNWERLSDRSQPGVSMPAAGLGATNPAASFPAHYVSRDPSDDIYQKMYDLNSAQRPMPVTEKEAKHWLDKEEQIREMDYDKWFQNAWAVNHDNPVMQKWAQQINPEYFKKKERQIDAQAELQKQLAKIKLYGVRDQDDLMLLYAITSGAMNVQDKSLFNPEGDDPVDYYQKGLFNPIKTGGLKIAQSRGLYAGRDADPNAILRSTTFQNLRTEAEYPEGLPFRVPGAPGKTVPKKDAVRDPGDAGSVAGGNPPFAAD